MPRRYFYTEVILLDAPRINKKNPQFGDYFTYCFDYFVSAGAGSTGVASAGTDASAW